MTVKCGPGTFTNQNRCRRAFPSGEVSARSCWYKCSFPLQACCKKMSSITRPASINLTKAFRSAVLR